MERDAVDMFYGGKTQSGMQILYAIVKKPTSLSNVRGVDPHKRIQFNEGDKVKFWSSVDYNPYTEEIARAAD